MAQKNNDFLNLPADFLSQLIFGAFLILILSMTGTSLALSVFLGIMGGFTLGWITTASKNSPQSQAAASSDGIDAGLKYWLFFLLGFSALGYSGLMSILLGGIGAIGGGWMVTWWKTKEETRTQLPPETPVEADTEQQTGRNTKQSRKVTRRFRRRTDGINFRFWQR